MEDYLEAIHDLEQSQKVARVKELARRLEVKMSSVSGALKALKARDLINHEAYGYITLTPEGRRLAEHVQERHQAILSFLREVLQIPAEEAEPEACSLEHALQPETLERLLALTEFLQEGTKASRGWLSHLGENREMSGAARAEAQAPLTRLTTLDQVPPGVSARVTKLTGQGGIRRRLLEMGIRRGAEIKVERIAPLGDPIEILVMGYHLSLRLSEAASVQVEIT